MKYLQDRFLLLISIPHLIFFGYKLIFGSYFVAVDSIEYMQMAENIYQHFSFYIGDLSIPINPEFYTKRPPLYSIFILIASLFLHSKALVLILQNILSIASICITKRMFEQHYGQTNKWVTYAFTLTSMSNFIYANLLMSEILFQFLVTLLMYCAHQLLTHHKRTTLISYQTVFILLLLTKPVFYLLALPNLILTYLFARKTNIRFGTLTAILPLLAIIFYVNWNHQRTGSYDYSSIQHINLRDYNLNYFHTYKYGAEHAREINVAIKTQGAAQSTYAEKVQITKQVALDHMLKDWTSFIPFHTIGMLKFFIDPGRYDFFSFFQEQPKRMSEVGFLRHLNEGGITGALHFLGTQPLFIIALLFITLIFNSCKFFGFVWFWLYNYKTASFTHWIMGLLILYMAVITGPLGAARFVIPILPLYLFFAIYGFSHAYQKFKRYRFRTT